VAGLVVSVAVSVVAWVYFDLPVFLVVLPLVPFLLRSTDRQPVRECPRCGFRTRDENYEYCPRDGERLE
jgi:hypothetical protein